MRFNYLFKFPESTYSYIVEVDEASGRLVISPEQAEQALPEWTRLEFSQCENCPLTAEAASHCPVAANTSHLIESFRSARSVTLCQVTVETEQRTYSKETDLQSGLCSVIGLIMATSGCPRLDFLRPMARFHLPFSDEKETLFRSLSAFSLGELLRYKDGATLTEIKEKMQEKYEQLALVNRGMADRIRAAKRNEQDANLNAIVILDSLGLLLGMELQTDCEELQMWFA